MAKDRIVDRRDLPDPSESAVWAVLHLAFAGFRGITAALCSQKAGIGRAPTWNRSRSKDIPSIIPAVLSAEEGFQGGDGPNPWVRCRLSHVHRDIRIPAQPHLPPAGVAVGITRRSDGPVRPGHKLDVIVVASLIYI